MRTKMVWVGIDESCERATRIFKSKRAAFDSGETVQFVRNDFAVHSIRHQIWKRSKGCCELCGVFVIETSAHMHESIPRGQGGEVSVTNSVFICPKCHRDRHKARNPQFTKNPLTMEPTSGTL